MRRNSSWVYRADGQPLVRGEPGSEVLAAEFPKSLPLLRHIGTLTPTDWLRRSMTTFGKNVASFLPGDFEAYARIYHPLRSTGGPESTWREIAARGNIDLNDRGAFDALCAFDPSFSQVRSGSMPPALIGILIEHLRPATTTPSGCMFAVWEGFGASVVPADLEPKLKLPNRAYHVFTGSIEAAHSSYDSVLFAHQSANLWWLSDHAWCVATEIDFCWSYVGGTRACIDALLADSRLEAMETTASADV